MLQHPVLTQNGISASIMKASPHDLPAGIGVQHRNKFERWLDLHEKVELHAVRHTREQLQEYLNGNVSFHNAVQALVEYRQGQELMLIPDRRLMLHFDVHSLGRSDDMLHEFIAGSDALYEVYLGMAEIMMNRYEPP